MTERAPYVYVVEMFQDGAWMPTCGVALTRERGRVELRQWRADNIYDAFRLGRYRQESSR